VLFADPRRSAVDIVQAVGRALRPAPGKQFGYVIVPILHDADATADDIFKSPAFKEILTTLRALAANDDRIIEYFRGVSQGRQRKGGGSVQFDIDERLAKRINLNDFAREIELKCWDKLAKLSWRPFEEAREFARLCGFRNANEWRDFCKGNREEKGTLPSDIPACPNKTYANNGWSTWGDWLGTGAIATTLREYLPFEKARDFSRGLGLTGLSEWYEFCRGNMPEKGMLPPEIPSNPDKKYTAEGWAGMGDWLGTGNISNQARTFLPFGDARKFARSLGLKNKNQWALFSNGKMPIMGVRPTDIPANPDNVYAAAGWIGWGDWFGTGNVANFLREYRSFEQARDFTRQLGLKTVSDWNDFCKGNFPEKGTLPFDIPATPSQTYFNKGWAGMGDWLGTGIVATHRRQYQPFDQAREFTRELGLKNVSEWRKFCSRKLPEKGFLPADIPSAPNSIYAEKGWMGWGDWLGTGTVAAQLRKYRPFTEARDFARDLGLITRADWEMFCKGFLSEKGTKPHDIPNAPNHCYANHGWTGWGDWLGTGTVAPNLRQYRLFNEARHFVRSLGLKNENEWRNYRKGNMPEKGNRPLDIPTNPNITYAGKGWNGMGDWLGTGRTRVSKSPKRKS
jgi:hypothetical protein